MNCKVYFWSPGMKWKKEEDNIKIGVFTYSGSIVELFPEFYYDTQDGVELEQLYEKFNTINKRKLKLILDDFIEKGILVNRLLTPQEIFTPEEQLYSQTYSKELVFNLDSIKEFKKKVLSRLPIDSYQEIIKLQDKEPLFLAVSERKSHRRFSGEEIPFSMFSSMLSILRQIPAEDGVKYFYASAGGLYPIDIYVHIKERRVEGLKQGIYYYCPVNNSLYMINENTPLTDSAHLFFNKDIFNSSAFSIYLFYNADASMPKYKGNAYYYACLDAGIITATLNYAAEAVGIGMCSIGEMIYSKVEDDFKVSQGAIYLHTIECGKKL